jgi:hypothetical protein
LDDFFASKALRGYFDERSGASNRRSAFTKRSDFVDYLLWQALRKNLWD